MIARIASILWCVIMLALAIALFTDAGTIRRADDRGYQLYSSGEYEAASTTFTSSYWKALALYRDGQLKDAANIFAGYDTAESHYNQGNALVFLGKYTAASTQYQRALELKPNWQAAITNRGIALARAKLIEAEGGEGTGGKLGADDTVITQTPKEPSSESEPTEPSEESAPLSDAELRAVWLRQVQTNPADFLKSKFSHQAQQHAKEAKQ